MSRFAPAILDLSHHFRPIGHFFVTATLRCTITTLATMYTDEEPVVEGVGLNLPPPAVDPDDPLLIAQTLTYVTDDGSVMLSFTSAPFSFGENHYCIN